MRVSSFLGTKRSRFTHLIFSANGAHERYDKMACQIEILKPQASTSIKIGTASNDGSGRRKAGGSSPGVALPGLKDSDTLSFKTTSGTCQYVTIHGRTSRGSWKTLYSGELKDVTVSAFLKNKRSLFTHVIFSVNGAHERYRRIACTAEIFKK